MSHTFPKQMKLFKSLLHLLLLVQAYHNTDAEVIKERESSGTVVRSSFVISERNLKCTC